MSTPTTLVSSPLPLLAPDYRDALITSGARFGESDQCIQSIPQDFGQSEKERKNAVENDVIAPLVDRGLILCYGEDSRSFLHNQLTSDVNHLAQGTFQQAGWCSAKGRLLSTFINYPTDEGYRLQAPAELIPAIVKRLQMFILRTKVKLSPLDNHSTLGLSVKEVDTLKNRLENLGLPYPDEPGQTGSREGRHVLRISHNRVLIHLPTPQAVELWRLATANGMTPVAPIVWDWLDIRDGLPRITGATTEEFVPQMIHLEKQGGVSFNKGCYPGQEIVARTHYLGKIKRHLFRVHCSYPLRAGDQIESVTPVETAPGQSPGRIVNAAPAPEGGYDALAVILESLADHPLQTAGTAHALDVTPIQTA